MTNKEYEEVLRLVSEVTNRHIEITNGNDGFVEVSISPLTRRFFCKPSTFDIQAKRHFKSIIRKEFGKQGIDTHVTKLEIEGLPKDDPCEDNLTDPILTDEELDVLTSPEEPLKPPLSLSKPSLATFMTLPLHERIDTLSELPIEDLNQLLTDISDAMDRRKENMILHIAELLEQEGIRLDEVAAIVGTDEANPIEPKVFSSTEVREKCKAWMRNTLSIQPDTPHKWFRNTHTWTQHLGAMSMPVNATTNGWYTQVKKELDESNR